MLHLQSYTRFYTNSSDSLLQENTMFIKNRFVFIITMSIFIKADDARMSRFGDSTIPPKIREIMENPNLTNYEKERQITKAWEKERGIEDRDKKAFWGGVIVAGIYCIHQLYQWFTHKNETPADTASPTSHNKDATEETGSHQPSSTENASYDNTQPQNESTGNAT